MGNVGRGLCVVALVLLAGCIAQTSGPPVPCFDPLSAPLVIAHRGASGYLPEHTLEAYALAIRQGAQYIEPDLVITRDGILVARHENELSETTDVAEKFPGRKAAKTVDGVRVEGWFSEDFTLQEIKTLRARERFPFRDQSRNGQFGVPSFEEILRLVSGLRQGAGRSVGLAPETKHPTYFSSLGLALEEPLVAALKDHGLDDADAPVFIQSFEVGNLKKLDGMTEVPLVQLVGAASQAPFDRKAAGTRFTYGDMITDRGLGEVAGYADGIGLPKALVMPRDRDGNLSPPTDMIERAHAAGLAVHAYTFRSEAHYLARTYGGDPAAEYRAFFDLGIDGVFTDFPDTAARAAQDFLCSRPPKPARGTKSPNPQRIDSGSPTAGP